MLILNGSNELYEVEAATYIKKTHADCKVGLVPDAGHTANMEQSDIYNLMLDSFLDGIA